MEFGHRLHPPLLLRALGETKLPPTPQMLEISLSTCIVRALAHLGQAGS